MNAKPRAFRDGSVFCLVSDAINIKLGFSQRVLSQVVFGLYWGSRKQHMSRGRGEDSREQRRFWWESVLGQTSRMHMETHMKQMVVIFLMLK